MLIALLLFTVLFLLVLRVPIGFALGACAFFGLLMYFGWRPGAEPDFSRGLRPALSLLGSTTFDFVHNFPLSMIPLYLGLGHVAYHAGITTDLYKALRIWLARAPGGLALASIAGCGGFSAITGSSVACAAAMGKIAVPEMLRYGYDARLATGAVASGGTVGSLIPPSLLFVIYAIFTEQSVKSLFLAGVLPGLLSLAGYALTVLIWVWLRPSAAPTPDLRYTLREKVRALRLAWPALSLLALITGGIYLGIFTPTEAAAASLTLCVMIGMWRGRLKWSDLLLSLQETARQTASIFLIAIGAKVFVALLSLTRVAPSLVDWVQGSGFSAATVVLIITLLYLVLGMFLDSIGILVLTLPFVIPLVDGFELNQIWFAVVVVKLLEIGLITPPVGLNVFVIKSVSPAEVSLDRVFLGAAGFLMLDFVVLGLILAFPWISLLIPSGAG